MEDPLSLIDIAIIGTRHLIALSRRARRAHPLHLDLRGLRPQPGGALVRGRRPRARRDLRRPLELRRLQGGLRADALRGAPQDRPALLDRALLQRLRAAADADLRGQPDGAAGAERRASRSLRRRRADPLPHLRGRRHRGHDRRRDEAGGDRRGLQHRQRHRELDGRGGGDGARRRRLGSRPRWRSTPARSTVPSTRTSAGGCRRWRRPSGSSAGRPPPAPGTASPGRWPGRARPPGILK